MIIERAEPSAVNDPSLLVDYVNPLRPGSVGSVGSVVHGVYRKRNRKFEARHEIIGDCDALWECGRLRVANVLFYIRSHLPFVLRMSFANINGEEIRTVLVLIVDLNEISDLAAKRRSSVAAKNQNERFLANPFVQIASRTPVERKHTNVGRAIADFEIPFVPLRQSVTKKTVNIARTAHEMSEDEISSEEQDQDRAENPLPGGMFALGNRFIHGSISTSAKGSLRSLECQSRYRSRNFPNESSQ